LDNVVIDVNMIGALLKQTFGKKPMCKPLLMQTQEILALHETLAIYPYLYNGKP